MTLTLRRIKEVFNLNRRCSKHLHKPIRPRKIPHYMFWIFGEKKFLEFDDDIREELKVIGDEMYHEDSKNEAKRARLLNGAELTFNIIIFFVGIVISILGGYVSNVIYDFARGFNLLIFSIISIVVISVMVGLLYAFFNAILDVHKLTYREYVIDKLMQKAKKSKKERRKNN